MSKYIMKYYMGKIQNLKCYMAIDRKRKILFVFEKNSMEVFTIENTEELAEKIMKDKKESNMTFEESVYKNIKSKIERLQNKKERKEK